MGKEGGEHWLVAHNRHGRRRRDLSQGCHNAFDAFAGQTTPLTPEEAWSGLNEGRSLPLAGGLLLRRVTVMHAPRIELTGFDAEDVPNLKAKGLTSEIISWKLRLFLPMSDDGPRILGLLLHTHRVIGAPPSA